MFESEIDFKVEHNHLLPETVSKAFAETYKLISHRTILHWEEHCTECMYPHCYSTCSLFSERPDGNCRQFVNGMVRVPFGNSTYSYLIKINFKKWGKLFTEGNQHLFSLRFSSFIEKIHLLYSLILNRLSLPDRAKKILLGKSISLKRKLFRLLRNFNWKSEVFLVECYNPHSENISVNITIRHQKDPTVLPFQYLAEIKSGYNRELISVQDIEKKISLDNPFKIEIIPNNIKETSHLFFGCIDFVIGKFNEAPGQSLKKIKCIVWDLDNTLWDGVLIEDGIDKLDLKKNVKDVLIALDKRGILNSIASKNNPADAIEVLKKFQIYEYFLKPQISWEPKSKGIASIAAELNIGIDSILFVDDQPFEREEVKSAYPNIRIMDAKNLDEILDLPETKVPVTEESMRRRIMYKEQEGRKKAQIDFDGDYHYFLKSCSLKLYIESLNDDNVRRVYELAQRTNQMNFSGNRYEMEQLLQIKGNEKFDTYVIKCEDKFGDYGIVGFGLVNNVESRLIDLMFSCRIQSKYVEHAFLLHLLKKRFSVHKRDFLANYKKTEKNKISGKVFDELGFIECGVEDRTTILKYPFTEHLEEQSIIKIFELK